MTEKIDSTKKPLDQEEGASKKPFSKRKKKVLSPEALFRIKRLKEVLLWLCETFPKTFSVSDPKPLKTDILKDIFTALPEDKEISRKPIREVISSYVKRGAYHRALIQSTHRLDLGGRPVQDIDPVHKTYAQEIVDARQMKKLKKQAKRKENKEKAAHKD